MLPPVFAHAADRPAFDVLGDRYTLLLSAEETGGAFSMFEFCIAQGQGTPPHIHSREDETFYLLEGELEFTVAGKSIHARAGDILFGPRNVAHNFKGLSANPARVLCLTSPGGFEKFFTAIGKVVQDKSQPPAAPTDADIQKLQQLAGSFGLTML